MGQVIKLFFGTGKKTPEEELRYQLAYGEISREEYDKRMAKLEKKKDDE